MTQRSDAFAPSDVHMSDVLSGKVAVVTGAGAGIGLAIARRFALAGAQVVLAARNRDAGSAAAKMLRAAGGDVRYVSVDVASEDDVRALIDATIAAYGGLSILVNNAGPSGDVFGLSTIHDLPTAIFEQTMRVGTFGPFWCCKYALPHMVAAQSGSIINISALPATRALPNMGAYAMAKAGLEALGRQVANDYACHGIRSNNLVIGTVRPQPGDVSTLPAGFDHHALDEAIGRTTMLGDVGNYADVAGAALFLASVDSRYITGANIPVEGGALNKVQYPDYGSVG